VLRERGSLLRWREEVVAGYRNRRLIAGERVSNDRAVPFCDQQEADRVCVVRAAKPVSLPDTVTSCDHDWKTDMIRMPRMPEYEYRSGRSRYGPTFAASSRIVTSRARMRPPGARPRGPWLP